jgi:hypothetical protein
VSQGEKTDVYAFFFGGCGIPPVDPVSYLDSTGVDRLGQSVADGGGSTLPDIVLVGENLDSRRDSIQMEGLLVNRFP